MSHKTEVIYEDDQLLAVHKPAGLLSIPDRYDPEKPNLRQLLEEQYDSIFTLHRLDRDTSGLVLFAKTEEANRQMQGQFQDRTIRKSYLAIIDGNPTDDQGTIDYPIGHNPLKSGQMVVHAKGKKSVTEYEVLERFRSAALLLCRPLTGRTHQIRVHLREIGHPLLVDPYYGVRSEFFLSEIKGRKYRQGKHQEERPLLSRLPLHAWKLEFRHPQTGETIELECDPPKDIRAVLNQLRKWAALPKD